MKPSAKVLQLAAELLEAGFECVYLKQCNVNYEPELVVRVLTVKHNWHYGITWSLIDNTKALPYELTDMIRTVARNAGVEVKP